jgi:hypothetical protein
VHTLVLDVTRPDFRRTTIRTCRSTRPGQRIAAAFVALEVLTRRLGSLNYAFVNRETETAIKLVSIGSRRKRP